MSKITIYERHKLVVDNVKIHGFYIMRNEDGKIMEQGISDNRAAGAIITILTMQEPASTFTTWYKG